MSCFGDLPDEVLMQLSALPKAVPDNFKCAICGRDASNRWNYSPRDYERPPICKSCESITGFTWNGSSSRRAKPTGGSFRDRREALRIAALADAIANEATAQNWRATHGCP